MKWRPRPAGFSISSLSFVQRTSGKGSVMVTTLELVLLISVSADTAVTAFSRQHQKSQQCQFFVPIQCVCVRGCCYGGGMGTGFSGGMRAHTEGITRSQISMEVSFLKKDSLSLRQFWSKIV